MKKHGANRVRRLAAVSLALVLLAAGCDCGRSKPEPPKDPAAEQSAPAEPDRTADEENRRAALKEAGERLDGYRWPRESLQKNILGQKTEFTLYHGNGWTIHVPAAWAEGDYSAQWESPSHHAGFSVSRQLLGIDNTKLYRARQGSWRHETTYDPPFDYYYDNDGGYTPPEGSADYIYFFAPDGEERCYEMTLSTVVGETTQEERALQEAMLLSFSLDDSSHVLRTGEYSPGRTEWEAALAGLLAQTEPIWFHLDDNGGVWEEITAGKRRPDYLPYVQALEDYRPGAFFQAPLGERPEGAPAQAEETITLCLPEMRIWLYFYSGSPWVHISHAGEEYWAELRHKYAPEQLIFDSVRNWLEAEQSWGVSPAQ